MALKSTISIVLILCLNFSIAIAHPGRTASDGCHYCRTNCGSWGEVRNQRHCHGGNKTPSYPETSYPTTPKTYTCPPNAEYSYSIGKCICSNGYALYKPKSKCVKIPKNAHAVESSTNAWECNYGYTEINNECKEENSGTRYYYNDCKSGSIKNYNTGTCDSPNHDYVSNPRSSFIHITPFYSITRSDNNAFHIYGTTSDNCYLIKALAYDPYTKRKDEYTLEMYKKGDTTFKYGIREDWNNLNEKYNYYRFTAYCENNLIREASTLIYFPPSF